MSDVVSAVLSIGIMIIEQLIFFVLWSSVFQWKQNKPFILIVGFSLLVVSSFFTNVFISVALAKLLIYFGLVFTLLRILCKNEWYVLLFLSAAGLAYLKAADSIIIYIFSFILNIAPQIFMENPYLFIFFALLSKLVEFICAWCFSRIFNKNRKKEATYWQSWLQALPLPVAACIFLSASLQLSITQPEASPLLLMLACVLLCLCILQMFIVYRLDNQQKNDEENRQLKQVLALRKESLQSHADAYIAQRSLTHEFNNRLAVITALAQQEKLPDLKRYLGEVNQTTQNSIVAIHTGNAVIDAVLNQKYRMALQHEIAFDFDMC